MITKPNTELADALLAAIPTNLPGLFNPFTDSCHDDTDINTAEARRARLAAHLSCDPHFICVGEAAGWLGMKRSAIAFTSERLLLEGAIPRVPISGRLSRRRLPYSEPSATIVWRTLKQLGIAESTVLWNALPLHPHKVGNAESNRTPTNLELMLGAPAMRLLTRAFPKAKVVAIGKKAELLLIQMGIPIVAQIRHPANGGATQFSEGLFKVVNMPG